MYNWLDKSLDNSLYSKIGVAYLNFLHYTGSNVIPENKEFNVQCRKLRMTWVGTYMYNSPSILRPSKHQEQYGLN